MRQYKDVVRFRFYPSECFCQMHVSVIIYFNGIHLKISINTIIWRSVLEPIHINTSMYHKPGELGVCGPLVVHPLTQKMRAYITITLSVHLSKWIIDKMALKS